MLILNIGLEDTFVDTASVCRSVADPLRTMQLHTDYHHLQHDDDRDLNVICMADILKEIKPHECHDTYNITDELHRADVHQDKAAFVHVRQSGNDSSWPNTPLRLPHRPHKL